MSQHYWFIVRTNEMGGREKLRIWADSPENAEKEVLRVKGCEPDHILSVRYDPIKPSDLKALLEETGRETFFFDHKTMQHFGDRMSNFGVTSQPIEINTYSGPALCWELYRRKPVKGGLSGCTYFDVQTLQRRFREE